MMRRGPCGGCAPHRNSPNRSMVFGRVQSFAQKYSGLPVGQIIAITLPHPTRVRGVSRSSRTRDGMRWTRQRRAREMFAGRSDRERALRAGRTALMRTAKPCGPDTRCWCQAVGGEIGSTGSMSHQAGSDGDKTNSSPGSNCVFVDLCSAGLKAGRCAPPPPAADGLDPVRPPVFRLGMRSAEAERGRSLCSGSHPISDAARSWC